MGDWLTECLVTDASEARALFAVREDGLAAFRAGLSADQAGFLSESGFRAAAQELAFLPGRHGIEAAVLGLGEDRSPYAFGDLAYRLPADTSWRLHDGDYAADTAILGFALGAYQFATFREPARRPARLVLPSGQARAVSEARAVGFVRDLINTPANLLGPADLARAAIALADAHGAESAVFEGSALDMNYPTVAAVGRGSARSPRVVLFRWRGSKAGANAPLIALCGKGVCFDTGGYDIKPSAGMLRMKKDMGGAASVLGIARLLMEADLPIRLAIRIGCVENSISGEAMRPSDVIRTRRGLAVEIGNTDAEGRLVLCDLLADASDEKPDLLVDCATLTGAARVALGPDLPALFCNNDDWAERLSAAGAERHDPLWRLPLWDGYDAWLNSTVADLNNIGSKPLAGAIVAALFLRRFLAPGVNWAHIDLYAWNDQTRPGRPEGGEAQAVRAVTAAVERFTIAA
ncbi:MAG: leucyl aminopeptidase family protein [Acetobacteraceae bacterium]|nr:leucyl aminopeptidase family protein [Acetobacteraceae bacterium]